MGHLAIALGRTLAEVTAMSAAEFAFWLDYRRTYGFPVDRLEAATALAGTAANRAMGGKAKPRDLIPRFGRARHGLREVAAYLRTLPGARVEVHNRPERSTAKTMGPRRTLSGH